MIFDFDIMHGGGVKFFDADSGVPITRISFVDCRRGMYGRWWGWEEWDRLVAAYNPGFSSLCPIGAGGTCPDAEFEAMSAEMDRPTRLALYRANIRVEFEDRTTRDRYERCQEIIERRSFQVPFKDHIRYCPTAIVWSSPTARLLYDAIPGTHAIVECGQ